MHQAETFPPHSSFSSFLQPSTSVSIFFGFFQSTSTNVIRKQKFTKLERKKQHDIVKSPNYRGVSFSAFFFFFLSFYDFLFVSFLQIGKIPSLFLYFHSFVNFFLSSFSLRSTPSVPLLLSCFHFIDVSK